MSNPTAHRDNGVDGIQATQAGGRAQPTHPHLSREGPQHHQSLRMVRTLSGSTRLVRCCCPGRLLLGQGLAFYFTTYVIRGLVRLSIDLRIGRKWGTGHRVRKGEGSLRC
eukprot:4961707-Pyramimonas_sp.AAC.1